MDSRVQTSEGELPVLAAPSVETETGGNEPGRLRHPVKRREDYEADRRKRREDGQDSEDEEQSLSGAAEDEAAEEQVSEEVDASAEENELPGRELDVKL